MPSTRFVSPERWWRAGLTVIAAGWLGWYAISRSASLAGIIVACIVVAGLVCLAVLTMRTHLAVSDEGVTDRRAVRIVRLPWQQIAEFSVARPGAFWGGFCVIAVCRDGSRVDLLSTRAYSRIPSARHLDELHRICWSLEAAASARSHDA